MAALYCIASNTDLLEYTHPRKLFQARYHSTLHYRCNFSLTKNPRLQNVRITDV